MEHAITRLWPYLTRFRWRRPLGHTAKQRPAGPHLSVIHTACAVLVTTTYSRTRPLEDSPLSEEPLYTEPTPQQRHVIMDVQFAVTSDSTTRDPFPRSSPILSVSLLIDDGTQVVDSCMAADDESMILRSIWNHIEPGDLIVALDDPGRRLERLRERSLVNGLKPTTEVELCRFYSHEVVDLMKWWSSIEIACRPNLYDLGGILDILHEDERASWTAERLGQRNVTEVRLEGRTEVRNLYEAFLLLRGAPIPFRYSQYRRSY